MVIEVSTCELVALESKIDSQIFPLTSREKFTLHKASADEATKASKNILIQAVL